MKIRGIVVHGKKEARTLGYPTANVEYVSSPPIEHGVWTCHVLIDGLSFQGLAVVGMWRLAGGEPSAEVHILDFDRDVYGKEIEILFGERLRALESFESVEKLKSQIEEDVRKGREHFLANI